MKTKARAVLLGLSRLATTSTRKRKGSSTNLITQSLSDFQPLREKRIAKPARDLREKSTPLFTLPEEMA